MQLNAVRMKFLGPVDFLVVLLLSRLPIDERQQLRNHKFKKREHKLEQPLTFLARVLDKKFEKPKGINRSRWDNMWLASDQIKYACIDAFISFEVARLSYSGQF